jgi:glyoxylase-like metal-dependent hydrolase (beta-lactamase superfamily II)
MLRGAFLPTEKLELDQNVLLVDNGKQLIMFDTGSGINAEYGPMEFGPKPGKLYENLRIAGFDPSDIDLIVLTHAHPDHCWGLVDDAQNRLYPNAQVAVSMVDYSYWTDLSRVPNIQGTLQRKAVLGTHFNLIPYADRLVPVVGDKEVVPGIAAIATPGHTPGHSAYIISSAGESLVVLGDLSHHQVLLLQRPTMEFLFDTDPAAAVRSRVKMLDMLATDRLEALAFHFPFPGRGHVLKQASGYSYLPTPIPLQ